MKQMEVGKMHTQTGKREKEEADGDGDETYG